MNFFGSRDFMKLANYKFNPNKPGIFQWQSVDDVFLMVVD
ncbi:Oligopeptide ABC transporter, periplasmic oligopeptide-binding protein OppA [Levilactobacillus brevis]|nr:Oligopeptide ABC transporter, periplasmic oligopeptide-binding protein OppA [Levilactobacillus brevis]